MPMERNSNAHDRCPTLEEVCVLEACCRGCEGYWYLPSIRAYGWTENHSGKSGWAWEEGATGEIVMDYLRTSPNTHQRRRVPDF